MSDTVSKLVGGLTALLVYSVGMAVAFGLAYRVFRWVAGL